MNRASPKKDFFNTIGAKRKLSTSLPSSRSAPKAVIDSVEPIVSPNDFVVHVD